MLKITYVRVVYSPILYNRSPALVYKYSETFMDERKSFLVKHLGLRGIAIFEAGKGLLGLALSFVLLRLRHSDIERAAQHALNFFHVNPDRHFYHEVLRSAAAVTTHTIVLFIFGTLAYAVI